MVVIFPKCAILPIKSSMLRGAVCSQCDSAFRVQKLSYYSNYRHGSCFQMLNSFMDMGDKYENQYPDLQFTRFGDLCINCRAPYIGEGNFEVSSLDIEGLSAQGANVGLAGVITNLIYDYYTKRVFPEFKLYPDPELAASPAIQIINNELLYIHKDVMSMPGTRKKNFSMLLFSMQYTNFSMLRILMYFSIPRYRDTKIFRDTNFN